MTFAEFMKKARKQNKISQRELARLSGVAKYTITRIESGRISPRLDTAEDIANVLGFELSFTMLVR